MDTRSKSKGTTAGIALAVSFSPGKGCLDSAKWIYRSRKTWGNIQILPILAPESGVINTAPPEWQPPAGWIYQEKIVTLAFWKTGFIADRKSGLPILSSRGPENTY